MIKLYHLNIYWICYNQCYNFLENLCIYIILIYYWLKCDVNYYSKKFSISLSLFSLFLDNNVHTWKLIKICRAVKWRNHTIVGFRWHLFSISILSWHISISEISVHSAYCRNPAWRNSHTNNVSTRLNVLPN